jgi:hypothetical protein
MNGFMAHLIFIKGVFLASGKKKKNKTDLYYNQSLIEISLQNI